MDRYVALLRGIAPSQPNMRNDKLREVFTELGFEAVGSVLSSGNIVFSTSGGTSAAALEDTIQNGLRERLGIAGGTIVRSRAQLETLFTSTTVFDGLTHGKATYLTATFLKEPPSTTVTPLPQPPDPAMQVMGYDASANVVLASTDTTGSTTPDFMSWLESTFGKDITTRTWLTVERILKKL
ncbi:DUF1697 domain-containing protein [Phytoactinopolyspora limicola]|uniref:DUF1697 domain-containing protein n=1 Tax=Phytoactinopolyspora limicola TaxID=2715536 RepID=UPI00140C62C4|nr:DUF1697 domain-containing protein [Phytoactinopolyspora limicola]